MRFTNGAPLLLLSIVSAARLNRYGLIERAVTASASSVEEAKPSLGTCSNNGQVVCNGRDYLGICDYGTAVWQKVAKGSWCEDGKVVGPYDDVCSNDGAIVCNGPHSYGICNSGHIVWQPTAAGSCCTDGKIVYCASSGPASASQASMMPSSIVSRPMGSFASRLPSYTSSRSRPTSAADSTPASSASCYLGGGPTATIENGVVHGLKTSLPAATAAVNKFLGIPFAKSPPTRFGLPEPAPQSQATINATAWSPSCLQQFVYPIYVQTFTEYVFNNPKPEESEDCLYLNVYAPSSPAPCDGRPVMVWIYGGALQFGNAGQPYYDGSSFAAYEDVIVVTINTLNDVLVTVRLQYRTNVFGFATSPEIPIKEQNLGFLDQRFALGWVQRNIESFGGSPEKVTIFGESAGGWSVDTLLTSYNREEKPPFRAAILESGQISYNPQPRPSTYGSWYQLADALNCSITHTSNLTCLREANATMIQDAIEQDILTFNPAWDNYTFYVNAAERRATGQIPNIPVLGGSNSQEGRIFEIGMNNSASFVAEITANYTPLVETITNAYPLNATDSGPTGYEQVSQIFTEYVFQCTQALWANASAAARIPTWRYYFNASFYNTQPAPNLGAYHSSEIPIVFGTFNRTNSTTQEYALSRTMMGIWARFARNPNAGPGWNPVGTGSSAAVLVGGDSTSTGGVYYSENGTLLQGNFDLGVLGNRGDVLGSGVTVIDSQEVDYRCGLFHLTYQAIVNMDQQSAAEEAEAAMAG
ncbi:hypothetical protein AC579_520 [Pseudocercospora musae]|uniref:Carboxylesterase type B domain-containing protein n=1 Tax=Pseudocercospora musae TaxID=113226 RepID=A0A139IRX3_9PEZI|nr:hypothetical protein AC579_520 [Pseudocercospora musae]